MSAPDVATLFERQARRSPQAAAVRLGTSTLSYRQLDELANAVAVQLHEVGAATGVVAVAYPRSLEAATAILGTLKAGAAYLPIDPDYPAERIRHLLSDSGAVVLLGGQDGLAVNLDARVTAPPPRRADLAYVIYTSGSTGQPKGVAMPHAPLVNLIEWQARRYPQPARTLQLAALSFDVSFQEMFSTWSTGGELVLMPAAESRDPEAVYRQLDEQAIERLYAPFSRLQQLALLAEGRAVPAALKEIITAGEAVQVTPALREFCTRLGASLDNHYGPTETHVVTAHLLDGDPARWPELPPIGEAIDGDTVWLLDEDRRPVADGEEGELYVSGVGLARGYLNRPELTAERFLELELGGRRRRAYRTGDFACRGQDGLEFRGRRDEQVKVRGYRIELGEVEAALAGHPQVSEVAVAARPDPLGGPRLVAYLIARPGASPSAGQLRDYLAERLPEFMQPAVFVQLDELPRTTSAKVDRRALPDPPAHRPDLGRPPTPPRTERERQLLGVWEEVLELDGLGVDDDFFALGGHSLSMVLVLSRLRSRLGLELAPIDFFASPTVAALATQAQEVDRAEAPVAPIVDYQALCDLTEERAEERLRAAFGVHCFE